MTRLPVVNRVKAHGTFARSARLKKNKKMNSTYRLTEPLVQRTSCPPDQLISLIETIDLSAEKVRLTTAKDGPGWRQDEADAVERVYRRWLFLKVTTPSVVVAPRCVDKFWHQHILDTRKYAHDCERVFGFFLHHFPYLGLRGPEDAEKLNEAFARSSALYESTFGVSWDVDLRPSPEQDRTDVPEDVMWHTADEDTGPCGCG